MLLVPCREYLFLDTDANKLQPAIALHSNLVLVKERSMIFEDTHQ
jgi:hypothetical protein